MSTLTATFSSRMENGIILHDVEFNRTPTTQESELFDDFCVNLSRAGHRMYRFDEFANHQDGACWSNPKDGIHTVEARKAYVKRVATDIAEAWGGFKATLKASTHQPKTTIFVGN